MLFGGLSGPFCLWWSESRRGGRSSWQDGQNLCVVSHKCDLKSDEREVQSDLCIDLFVKERRSVPPTNSCFVGL